MKRVTVAELEKVVAELAVENGNLRTQLNGLAADFAGFIEMDKKWSEKISEAVTALIDRSNDLKEGQGLNQALLVNVMRRMDISIEEALGMVEDAKAALDAADKELTEMTDDGVNEIVKRAKEAMSNVH